MNALLIIAACTLPADPHWAIGGWQTRVFGGSMIRPDHYVIERDPDGNITDVGVWYDLDDNTIAWVSITRPTVENYLSRDGSYFHTYSGGHTTPTSTATLGVIPQEFYSYVIGREDEE